MDKTLKMFSHMPFFNPCNMYLLTDIILWKLKFKERKQLVQGSTTSKRQGQGSDSSFLVPGKGSFMETPS